MAQRAVERNPRDLHARVWYGHLLLRQAQQVDAPQVQAMAEAKSQFDQALAIAPLEPSAWNGLFTLRATSTTAAGWRVWNCS
jgi:hypothetical protein